MAFLLAVVFLSSVSVFAQDTSSITGTIGDTTGGVLPGASVTIRNTSRGIERPTLTNSSGDYLVAGLPQGQYDVTVSMKGFKTFQANGVVLQGAQKLRLDVTLSVSAMPNEVVTVEGSYVAQIEEQSSELAGTITSTQISELELNGRNFSQLLTLIPGVSNGGDRGEAGVGLNGFLNFNVNGGRTENNNWEMDGGSILDNGSNGSLNLFPSLDAIAEVRVLTSNYGAQYGLNGSGTVEVVTKAGTDHFHGDLYEYVRNEVFNANGYFNNASNIPRPPFKRNDFGYTLGGPVFIPGHYNSSRKKTFFFWSEEWRLFRNPFTFDQGVPSDAERAGNFNDVCNSPNFNDFCPIDRSTGQPFPNNQVPVDPNGAALLSTAPHANETSQAALNDPQCLALACFVKALSAPEYWREEMLRIDHNLTTNHRLMFRYSHDSWNRIEPQGGASGIGSGVSTFPAIPDKAVVPGTSIVTHLTSTFSPSLLNEFIASYNVDHVYFNFTNTAWQLPSTFTKTGLFPNQNPLFGGKIPGISLKSADTIGSQNDPYGGGLFQDPSCVPWTNSAPTYNFKDTVAKIVRKHNLQFGSTFVIFQKNEPGVPDIQGLFNFDSTAGATLQNGALLSTDNVIADVLMGNIISYAQTNRQPKYYNRYKVVEPFFQDDWHVRKNLTLNLGLRISLFGTYRDVSRQSFNWDPAAFIPANAPQIDPNTGALVPGSGNPFNGLVQCGGPGGAFGPPGEHGFVAGSRYPGCMKGHLVNPGPRIGFAWDPQSDGKTALRGGYGIFFEHGNGNEANAESLESTPPIACTPQQLVIAGYNNLGGGGAPNACGGLGVLFPLRITAISPKTVWPYVQQWNLDIERELLPQTVFTVAYVGSKGTHLSLQRDLNQLLPTPPAQNPFAPGQPITTADCTSFSNSGTLANGTLVAPTAAINLGVACGNNPDPFRPHQGFSTITVVENQANSNYNALQVSLRRSEGPLVLSVAYTYSHSLDNSSDRFDGTFVNSYDLKHNYASSNFDQRQVLNISYVYDLPFFRHPGFKHAVLGGWELSGIISHQTGTPFSVIPQSFGDAAGVANGVGGGAYVDIIGDPDAIPPGQKQAPGTLGPLLFNPAAFAPPRGLTFGNEGRNRLNRPGYSNFDMALFKKFAVTEHSHVEIRAEAFNVFNHTEFSNVNTTINNTNFLRPSGAYEARLMELALKFIF